MGVVNLDGGEHLDTVHVVFGTSIAATLREALPQMGLTGCVVGLPEILSVGPIDPPDVRLRQAWATAVLNADGRVRESLDPNAETIEACWAIATDETCAPVVWACLTSPMEHAGFLCLAERLGGRPFDLIDATGARAAALGDGAIARSLGQLRVADVVALDVAGRRRSLTADECHAAAQAWGQLRRENAPFRIVTDGCLVSAPITHYDTDLIDEAGPDWEIAARVIGRVVAALSETGPPGRATSDVVLLGRLLTLAENGLLEIEGPGPGLRDYRIRRAAQDA